MKHKILIIYSVFLVTMIQGCAIFKKRSVDKQTQSFSHSSSVSEKTDSSSKQNSTTEIIEHEKADTTVRTPEKKYSSSVSSGVNNSELVKGLTTIDNDLVTVRSILDTATNQLKTDVIVKPQDLNLKVDKSKTTRSNNSNETDKHTSKNNKESTEAKNASKHTESEPKGLAWLWIIVVSVVIIISVGLWLYFKKPKIKPG